MQQYCDCPTVKCPTGDKGVDGLEGSEGEQGPMGIIGLTGGLGSSGILLPTSYFSSLNQDIKGNIYTVNECLAGPTEELLTGIDTKTELSGFTEIPGQGYRYNGTNKIMISLTFGANLKMVANPKRFFENFGAGLWFEINPSINTVSNKDYGAGGSIMANTEMIMSVTYSLQGSAILFVKPNDIIGLNIDIKYLNGPGSPIPGNRPLVSITYGYMNGYIMN